MYPDVSISESAAGILVALTISGVRLSVTLTPDYPDAAAPTVEVSAPSLPACTLEALRTHKPDSVERSECLMELLGAAEGVYTSEDLYEFSREGIQPNHRWDHLVTTQSQTISVQAVLGTGRAVDQGRLADQGENGPGAFPW